MTLSQRIKRLAEFKRKYPYQEILAGEDVIGERENARLIPLIAALAECAEATRRMCDAAESTKRMWEVTAGASGFSMRFDYGSVAESLTELERLVTQMEKERGV